MRKTWAEVNALYQIYPRSFQDASGDGVGDLKGITSRLDYVASTLGVDAVWISPFYPSPQTDCGYDVSDYCGVDGLFGTLDDFDELLKTAHEKGLKVMLDLVPNHTSDQHPWFQEARQSKDNPKRDWYVWRDQPNNWRSISGGSSWTLDKATGQYYLHSFLPTQPDLNWENAEVRRAMQEVIRFWFTKGVDGFRVDAVWGLSKDVNFTDDPINPTYTGHPDEYGTYQHSSCKNGPKFVEYLREITAVAHEYDDRYILFEYYSDTLLGDVNDQLRRLHQVDPQVAAPFYFEGIHQPWHADHFGRELTAYLHGMSTSDRPSVCFSNHDQPRLITRYGAEQARLIACLQLTLPGMPVLYYGDEIGMENVSISPELTKDKFEKTGDSGGRDPERTPMQWDGSLYGGFSEVAPWLPLHDNKLNINVDSEFGDPASWLSMYQQLLSLRRDPVLQHGSFEVVESGSGYVLAYKRELDQKRYYVICNFADGAQIVELPEPVQEVVAATRPGSVLIRADGRVSAEGFAAGVLSVASGQDS